MRFESVQDVAPASPLQPYVRSIRFIRLQGTTRDPDRSAASLHRVRIPPDGTGYVLIRLRGEGVKMTLAGPRTSASDIDLFSGGLTIAVRFRVGGLQALCQQPACEWLNRTDSLRAADAVEVDRLKRQLADAPALPDRLEALNAAFKQVLRPSPLPHSTVSVATAQFSEDAPVPTVRDVAQAVGISARHLRTLFRQHVGLAPKAFARIARLHHVVHAQRNHPEASWSALALDAGYYDQSHLVADFQDLMGESPSVFRARDRALMASA